MTASYETRLLINGELTGAAGSQMFDNINPADGSVIGQAVDAQPEDVERAVASARRAFDQTDWAQDHAFRNHCLLQFPKMAAPFDGGFWVEPTLFVEVDPSSAIAQTEIFGPVLTVYRYTDDDDAVRIANATPYGLAGFVQSRDTERAVRIARRLRAGSIGINGTATWMHQDLPFGGYGISGLGREHGVEGFEEYLQSKAVTYPA